MRPHATGEPLGLESALCARPAAMTPARTAALREHAAGLCPLVPTLRMGATLLLRRIWPMPLDVGVRNIPALIRLCSIDDHQPCSVSADGCAANAAAPQQLSTLYDWEPMQRANCRWKPLQQPNCNARGSICAREEDEVRARVSGGQGSRGSGWP